MMKYNMRTSRNYTQYLKYLEKIKNHILNALKQVFVLQ